jgi:hypothetical protein
MYFRIIFILYVIGLLLLKRLDLFASYAESEGLDRYIIKFNLGKSK